VNLEELRVNSFLRFGYFCDYSDQRAPIDFSGIDKSLYDKATREDLISLGVEKLRETFSRLWQEGRQHVVPLSGGLDSRLILGAILEHVSAEQLQTYTYGIPGAYDFEISNSIARKLGTQHLPVSLAAEMYSLDAEISAAKRTGCQAVLFHHPPLERLDQQFPGALFWSGYVGDAVAGSYLQDEPSATLREAQIRLLRNRVRTKSIRLIQCNDEEFLPYMRQDHIDPNMLTLDEQVFCNEVAPKVAAPLILYSGH